MGDGTMAGLEDDADLSALSRGPFGRWEPPDTDVILGSHAQGAVPDFPLWPEPDGDIAPLGWDEGGDGGGTGPARDFAGIEGPAEPPGVNPCAEEEAACAEGLEAAGMSDTHWCDCVKGWDGKCVCLVYAFNDDTGDDDDRGSGGGGGAGNGPHDPPDWRAGLIIPPVLPILRIPPIVAPIEMPVVPPWVFPILLRPDNPRTKTSATCTVVCYPMPEPGCEDPVVMPGIGGDRDQACTNAQSAAQDLLKFRGCAVDECEEVP